MSTKTFILCPGQGAQVVGMGKDFAAAFPAAQNIFDLADRAMNGELSKITFEGPPEKLNQTDISQPAIFTTSTASFMAGVAAGLLDPTAVTAFAGLSLGEYTALHLAGVFSFDDGLKLVIARGRYMQEAAIAVPSGMVALLGAEESAVQKLCDDAAQGEVLVIANYNTPGQIVISGTRTACERAVAIAGTTGIKATPLPVAGAFHSPLMQPAADKMRAELDAVRFNSPAFTVYSNVTAEPHTDPESIKDLLVRQIVSPVKWEQTARTLITGNESERFIELAPNRHLAGLAKRINRRLPIETWSAAAELKYVAATA